MSRPALAVGHQLSRRENVCSASECGIIQLTVANAKRPGLEGGSALLGRSFGTQCPAT